MAEQIYTIIGCITGCVSLIGIIYFLAFWRGGVDSDRKYFHDCISKYPPAVMHTMLITLWDVYVLDPLHHRPDLATHKSPYRLTKKGEGLIPDRVKVQLANIPDKLVENDDIATGFAVVRHLGIPTIESVAKEKGLSVQETIAILSTYLENRTNHADPF